MTTSQVANESPTNPQKVFIYSSVGHLANDGTVFVVPVIADTFAALRGVSAVEITALSTLFLGVPLFASPLISRLADRSGRHAQLMSLGVSLLALGLAAFFAAFVAGSAAPRLALLFAGAFMTGLGSSFYHPLTASILESLFGAASGGRAMGYSGAIGGVGAAAYPALFSLVDASIGTNASLLGLVLLNSLFAAMVLYGMRSSTKVTLGGTKSNSESASLVSVPIIVLTVIAFLRAAALEGVGYWLPEYLSYDRGFGTSIWLGITVGAVYAASIGGEAVFGHLVDRIDGRMVLALSGLVTAAGIAGFELLRGPLSILFLLIYGVSFVTFPVLLMLSSRYVPARDRTSARGLVYGLGNGSGNLAGPILAGLAAGTAYGGLGAGFILLSVVSAGSAVLALLLP